MSPYPEHSVSTCQYLLEAREPHIWSGSCPMKCFQGGPGVQSTPPGLSIEGKGRDSQSPGARALAGPRPSQWREPKRNKLTPLFLDQLHKPRGSQDFSDCWYTSWAGGSHTEPDLWPSGLSARLREGSPWPSHVTQCPVWSHVWQACPSASKHQVGTSVAALTGPGGWVCRGCPGLRCITPVITAQLGIQHVHPSVHDAMPLPELSVPSL